MKVTVGVSNFRVDRHGDRAIFLSGCFGAKKGIGAFYLDCTFDVRVDGIDVTGIQPRVLIFHTRGCHLRFETTMG